MCHEVKKNAKLYYKMIIPLLLNLSFTGQKTFFSQNKTIEVQRGNL